MANTDESSLFLDSYSSYLLNSDHPNYRENLSQCSQLDLSPDMQKHEVNFYTLFTDPYYFIYIFF